MLANIFWLLQGGPFRTLKGTFSCGHEANLKGGVRSDDHDFAWDMYPSKARTSICPTCAIEASILCCFCEKRIYPGNPVAVYGKTSGGINWDIATTVGEDQVIGCLRWKCCPSGGYYAGKWTADGFKSAWKSQEAAA